ncbi:MAG: exosortase E/protease, VPEID-CTERM system [Myxococcales bacterium]|jgi:exosortase E/protease (VPEID-CTERM system)
MPERAPQPWFVRPLVALLILTSEYLAITLSFDAAPLLERVGLWGGLGWMGLVGPAVIAFVTALWIMGGASIKKAFAEASRPSEPRRLWPAVLVQLLSFTAFYLLTAVVFGAGPSSTELPMAWIGLWILAGASTLASALPIAFGRLQWRRQWRELAVPFGLAALLSFVAWAAGLSTLLLWDRLGDATLYAVASILEVLVSPIHFDPSQAAIGTESFWIRVAPICSGYEGIGLILVFLSAYLAAFRKRFRFPRVLLLVPVAVAAVWFLNVARIVALILLGHFLSPSMAIGGFHSKAGWLLFCGVALGAVWVSEHLPWFARDPQDARSRVTNPSAPFLLPLLALVATTLITGLFVDRFDYFYPLRVVVVLLVLAWYRDEYAAGLRNQLRGRRVWSWQAAGIGVSVYLLWVGFSALRGSYGPEAIPDELMSLPGPVRVAWIVSRALGAIVTVPIVEELAFRGFLLRRLIGSNFTRVPYDAWRWPAVLISSLAFAAVHQEWLGGFAAGVLFAYAQKRRGLLSDAIVAHAISNALIAVQVLVAGHWSLW